MYQDGNVTLNHQHHENHAWILFSIGCIYFIVGIAGILINLLDTLAIVINKTLLTNPFYFFILNLCIADALCLVALGCYTGLAFCQTAQLINDGDASVLLSSPIFVRIFGFVINCSYYASGWILVMITLTRLIALGYSHLTQKIFTPMTMKLIALIIWIIYISLAVPCLFHTSIVYIMEPAMVTWRYNLESMWPYIFNIYDMVHNIVTMSFIVILNLWAVVKLKKQTSQTATLANSQSHRLEVKLFIQCAISGGFYCGEGVMFAIFTRIPSLPRWVMFISHMLWVMNHVNNSLVYLILNTKLRKTIKNLWNKNSVNVSQP